MVVVIVIVVVVVVVPVVIVPVVVVPVVVVSVVVIVPVVVVVPVVVPVVVVVIVVAETERLRRGSLGQRVVLAHPELRLVAVQGAAVEVAVVAGHLHRPGVGGRDVGATLHEREPVVGPVGKVNTADRSTSSSSTGAAAFPVRLVSA